MGSKWVKTVLNDVRSAAMTVLDPQKWEHYRTQRLALEYHYETDANRPLKNGFD